ncbi:S8 family serine peptidase [Dactylosporangium salmoneum]|uniref:Peptidase S8/S53 domain-containing protein n=1 Tax=Dactylosporangium salmoneum TaxID=53361 RepID=A0ABP5SSI3_9ACTN
MNVRRQIEKVLDEDGGRTVGVVVQMHADPAGPAADLGHRAQATSAREVLPEPVRAVRSAAVLAGTTAGGVPNARPAVPDLAGGGPAQPGLAAVRSANAAALEPLLATDAVRGGGGAVRPFWPSRSAYVELDRDELAKLSGLPGLAAVYPNVELALPPVAAARELPTAVLENSASSWGVTAVGALAAWGAYGARGAGVTVGVLDSGVQADHPDLAGKVKHWAEFDDQGHPVDSTPRDTQGHGTHVCGTIAGGDRSGQWIGVAPEAELAVARVLPNGRGTLAQIQAGLTWAIEQRVDVISMSLSAPLLDDEDGFVSLAPNVFTESFLTCMRAGIPVVAAIGNRGGETGATTGGDVFALGVGATDYRDVVAGFSGGLSEVVITSTLIAADKLPLMFIKPDICAPGMAVTSSYLDGTWKALNGTSMATPHVAGAVALLLSAVPSIRTGHEGFKRAAYVIEQLIGSADELGEAGQDARYGFGRLNVLRAIALARSVGSGGPQ